MYEISRNTEVCAFISAMAKFKFKKKKCRSSVILVIYHFIYALKLSVWIFTALPINPFQDLHLLSHIHHIHFMKLFLCYTSWKFSSLPCLIYHSNIWGPDHGGSEIFIIYSIKYFSKTEAILLKITSWETCHGGFFPHVAPFARQKTLQSDFTCKLPLKTYLNWNTKSLMVRQPACCNCIFHYLPDWIL